MSMAWSIEWDGKSVEYVYRDESFEINEITLKERDIRDEPSSGYQEPNDTVMHDIYKANTEHGDFEWSVTARTSGYETHAEIDDVEYIKIPNGCESEAPSFEISTED
ncbi:hypothetical protein [Pseudoalteromonas sp. SR44-2]|uniref:hypothetical protein n=1 Tax=Pseudoalteromonas sp. SR44-2 TaxID=2760937 RepID=UPI00160439C1|nr:hypothetical protein [Pseudoalteromonas sp. SR44-2]